MCHFLSNTVSWNAYLSCCNNCNSSLLRSKRSFDKDYCSNRCHVQIYMIVRFTYSLLISCSSSIYIFILLPGVLSFMLSYCSFNEMYLCFFPVISILSIIPTSPFPSTLFTSALHFNTNSSKSNDATITLSALLFSIVLVPYHSEYSNFNISSKIVESDDNTCACIKLVNLKSKINCFSSSCL
eukprot:NODE_13_length_42895_cov_0.518413.p19 type:complete len:183 gc:universal NODE_13_length_42895_cov_0.518413:27115-27663(+)